MPKVDITKARTAKRQLAAELAGNPHVNGVGIKPVDGGYALKVNLYAPAPDLELPGDVDGVDVHVEVTGRGFPQPA